MTRQTDEVVDGLWDNLDPVVMSMVMRLPKEGSEWPLGERADWLRAMEGVLTMVYGRCDHVDIKETLIVADMIEHVKKKGRAADSGFEGRLRKIVDGAGSQPAEAAPTVHVEPKVLPGPTERVPVTKTIVTGYEAPKKNVGGAPTTKNQRPAGIPSNLEMAIEGIEKAENKKASAPHLREFVRRTYWPDCPESWTAVLYDFVKSKKLERDGLSFILPARTAPEALVVKPVEPPKAPVVAQPSPPPAPPPAPRPPAPQGVKFEHGDKACMLPSSRAYVLVGKLRNAMGKGHISEAFLAENVLGSNTEHNRTLARRLCLESNDELAKVGLKIENHPGYGLLMKDA